MKEATPIHVRIVYPEAIRSRTQLLSSELSLLNFLKTFQRYELLRKEEALLKMKFYRELKRLDLNIKKLETLLPEVKKPKILHSENSHPLVKDQAERDIEDQLRQIKEKLKAISGGH